MFLILLLLSALCSPYIAESQNVTEAVHLSRFRFSSHWHNRGHSTGIACPQVQVNCLAHQFVRFPAKHVACVGQVMGPRLGYLPLVAMQARAFFQVCACRV